MLLFLTALVWASNWVVARAVVPHASPMSMGFWRWATAIVVLLPFAGPQLVRDWPHVRRAWRAILFFGTCGTVVYVSIGYLGVRTSTATNAVLFQSFTSAWIPLLAWLIFRERPRVLTMLGLAISFAGVLAIISRLDAAVLAGLQVNPGDFWLLLNTLMWAVYTACLRWKPAAMNFYSFLLAIALAGMLTGVPAWLIELRMGGGVEPNPGAIAGIVYLGTVPTLLGYMMWNRGVAIVGPVRAGAYLHLIPPLGAAMAIVFLGEALRLYHVLGFGLILGGVWLAARRRP